jgi:hypothetical protein
MWPGEGGMGVDAVEAGKWERKGKGQSGVEKGRRRREWCEIGSWRLSRLLATHCF